MLREIVPEHYFEVISIFIHTVPSFFNQMSEIFYPDVVDIDQSNLKLHISAIDRAVTF